MRLAFRSVLYGCLLVLFIAAGARVTATDWRIASHEPVGLAPDPAMVSEAVVQVYGARTVGIKGLFGVHTWVAVKPTGATSWTVYEVIGWRLRRGPSVLVVREREPDARWFGASPDLYADKRGKGVDRLIERIDQAARAYPYAEEYRAWPGPNSNTFTAWIARAVPELEIDLPATAIGKDYLGGSVFATAPSGSGFQVSLGGMLGVAASGVDGFELNVLGLNFGASANGLKLPLVGRLGKFQANSARTEPSTARSAPPARTTP
jgi:Protein of unknown function (DUF3750)